jgi:hypothetical protein
MVIEGETTSKRHNLDKHPDFQYQFKAPLVPMLWAFQLVLHDLNQILRLYCELHKNLSSKEFLEGIIAHCVRTEVKNLHFEQQKKD